MKYAIAQIQGHQYRIEEGKEITVDRLQGKVGDQITFNQVYLLVNDQQKQIGQPTIDKANITAKILTHIQGKKIRVATYKAKARSRKIKGHRSKQTKILIGKIIAKNSEFRSQESGVKSQEVN
jgi:large subunit ribosomal protein L21